MVQSEARRIRGRAVGSRINFAACPHKSAEEILDVSIAIQKLFAILSRPFVRPMILPKRDEALVERYVLEQRIVKDTRVVDFEIERAVDDSFPFEVEGGIQVHIALDEGRDHLIEKRRLH